MNYNICLFGTWLRRGQIKAAGRGGGADRGGGGAKYGGGFLAGRGLLALRLGGGFLDAQLLTLAMQPAPSAPAARPGVPR